MIIIDNTASAFGKIFGTFLGVFASYVVAKKYSEYQFQKRVEKEINLRTKNEQL